MKVAIILGAMIVALSPQGASSGTLAQDPAVPPVQLEDVVVTGRRLEDVVRSFVDEVAEPNDNRGPARWYSRLCVGVVNLRQAEAEYIADRISTIADDVGLQPGAPGCVPNVLVVATADGGEMARTLVEMRGGAFQMGGGGMDRGSDALQDFVDTERPVRWWQVSMPVDSETGNRATRMRGECLDDCETTTPSPPGRARNLSSAPIVRLDTASRLRTQIVDRLIRTVVIIDIDDVTDLTINQLSDYIAMVALAQIDPDADTSGYVSILNVLDTPEAASALTGWDRAYLTGLYESEQNRLDRRAGSSEIVSSIVRANQSQ